MSGNVTLGTAHHSCGHAHFPSAFALSTRVLVETARLKKSEKLSNGLLTMHSKERLLTGNGHDDEVLCNLLIQAKEKSEFPNMNACRKL